MKRGTLIIAAIILFFIIGCDKYHRNRYTGTWDFVTTKTWYTSQGNGSEPTIIKSETIYYTGKISLGTSEKEIIIRYTENDETNAVLSVKDKDDKEGRYYREGGIYAPNGMGQSHYATCGRFEGKDKLNFNLQFWVDSLQGYEVHRIAGTKKGRSGK